MLSGYKTLIGLLVAFLGQSLQMAGVEIGDPQEIAGLITVTLENILTLVGLGLAVYGRVVAKRRVLTEEPLK